MDKETQRVAKAFGIDATDVTSEHRESYRKIITAHEREAAAERSSDASYPAPNDATKKFAPGEVAHVEPRLDLMSKSFMTTPAEKLTRDKGLFADQIRDLHTFNDNCVFMQAILSDGGRRIVNMRESNYWKSWMKSRGEFGKWVNDFKGEVSDPEVQKATFTTTTGADWVPTILSNDFTETMRHDLHAATSIKQVDMHSKVVDLPGEGADAVAYKTTEAATVTAGDIDDRKSTLTAVDIKARSRYTDDIDEDSIIAVLPHHRENHARALADGIEFAVVHGDENDSQGQSSNSSQDGYLLYDAWDGIHAQCISATTAEVAVGGTAYDGADALAQLDALGPYARADQCMWLCHPALAWRMRLVVDYMATGL